MKSISLLSLQNVVQIIVFHFKERFSIFNCKLGQNGNTAEYVSMFTDVMPKSAEEATPLLETFVDRFMMCSHTLLHQQSFLGVCEASRAFDLFR
jgi:hypothetical protein